MLVSGSRGPRNNFTTSTIHLLSPRNCEPILLFAQSTQKSLLFPSLKVDECVGRLIITAIRTKVFKLKIMGKVKSAHISNESGQSPEDSVEGNNTVW